LERAVLGLDVRRDFTRLGTGRVAALHHALLSQRLQPHAQQQVAVIARRFKAIHAQEDRLAAENKTITRP